MKVFIITHKEVDVPLKDNCYQLLFVGADLHKDIPDTYVVDNSGSNISTKNPYYCELTGQYWIWKNYTDDIVGFCHYRRLFVSLRGKIMNVLTGRIGGFLGEKDFRRMLSSHDIIRHNATFCKKTVGESFRENHIGYEELRNAIQTVQPEYLSTFDSVMNGHIIHLLNIVVMRKELFDEYSQWLFSVLSAVEAEMGLNKETSRLFGFMSERLLDVWIKGRKLRVKNAFTINTEFISRSIIL